MKTLKINTSNESKKSTMRVLVIVLLLLLSSIGVFGQNTSPNNSNGVTLNSSNSESNLIELGKDIVSLESQIDFVGWFMGSKFNQNSTTINSDNVNSTLSTKKQILSSGVTPNKVLYKTFVKKVMNKDNALV